MSQAAPVVTFSPTSLTFASQEVGTASAGQTVTLTNTGTANLTNFIIELPGDANAAFSETTTTCGLTVAIGSCCSINVTFTAASAGSVSASLVVLDANGHPVPSASPCQEQEPRLPL
jgi:Abnormal spindle-like microcephaly-assoc'd, ASPM-SPD-2-Hydin